MSVRVLYFLHIGNFLSLQVMVYGDPARVVNGWPFIFGCEKREFFKKRLFDILCRLCRFGCQLFSTPTEKKIKCNLSLYPAP